MTTTRLSTDAPFRSIPLAVGLARQRGTRCTLELLTPADRRELCRKRWQGLVERVKHSHPFYQRHFRHATPSSMDSVPLLSKRDIVDHFDLLASWTGVTAAQASNYLAKASKVGLPIHNRCLVFASSGSTGTPSFAVHDLNDFGATIDSFHAKAIATTDGRRKRLAYIGLLDRHNGGSAWMHYLRNLMAVELFDVFAPTATLVDELSRFKPDVVLTRPTRLRDIGESARERGIALPTSRLISVGEPLGPWDRERIVHLWGLPPNNSYSTVETGPIGFQMNPYQESLEIYDDLHWVELYDDRAGYIEEPGRKGRILVTTLYNRRCPLIRYDTGDWGAWDEDGVGTSISLLGRNRRTLVFRDGLLECRVPELPLWNLAVDGVAAYQIIQVSRNTVRCCYEPTHDPARSAQQIEREITKYVQDVLCTSGCRMKVRVLCSPQRRIAIDRKIGKVQRVVPLSG
jgi:phenylacetate-coenzyme A ligase PaaK-like adenylate-forming protein